MKKAIPVVSLLFALPFLLPGTASAGDASSCVKLGYGKQYKWSKTNERYIENRCNRKVEIVWCHNNNERKNQRSHCGGKNYYRQHRAFNPGERHFNQYSVPDSGTIYYGACTGGYYSTYGFNGRGGYRCKN